MLVRSRYAEKMSKSRQNHFYRCHLICMLSYSETIVRVLCIEYAMCDINRSKLSYLILAEIVLEGNNSIGTLGMR